MKRLPKRLFCASYDKDYVTPVANFTYTSTKRKGAQPKRLSKSGPCRSKSEKVKSSVRLNEQAIELLRKEAFIELQRQIQHYNDQLVTRMRFIESLPYEEQQPWLEAFVQHDRYRDQDEDIEFIIDAMNDSATIKDYSPVIEWQQNKLPDITSDCIYSYTFGDKW